MNDQKQKLKKAIDKMEMESKINQFQKRKIRERLQRLFPQKKELTRNQKEEVKGLESRLKDIDKMLPRLSILISLSIIAFIYTYSLTGPQQMSLMEKIVIFICCIGIVVGKYKH